MAFESYGTESADRLLDRVGWHILEELQTDARISFSELGRRVGLSAPAVAERVRRMEEAGIITGYTACINPARVGLPLMAIIRLRGALPDCATMARRLERGGDRFPEVVECHRITGEDSYIMKVVVATVAHLEGFLDRLAVYGATTTSIVLSSPVPGRIIDRQMAGHTVDGSSPDENGR